jgi:hypothetical protein
MTDETEPTTAIAATGVGVAAIALGSGLMDHGHYDESSSTNLHHEIPEPAPIEDTDHHDSQTLKIANSADNAQDSNSSVFEVEQQPVRPIKSARAHRASISTQRLEMDAKTLGGHGSLPLYVAGSRVGAGKYS